MNPSPVKGTHDLYALDASKNRYVREIFKSLANLYNFHELNLPILEYTEVFQRGTGESSDIVRKEMYTFLDKGNRSVTLRPEFTAGVMRSIVSNKLYATEDLPIKIFYEGPAFRYERPQLGRYRQFTQFGVESIGIDTAEADAEAIVLAAQSFNMLGFDNISIKINTLGDEESRNAYRGALKEYFSKHIDEMCPDCHERIKLNPLRMLDCKVERDQEIAKGAPKIKDYLSIESEERFHKTLSILANLEIDYEVDDNLVRGLDYYSEVVFEIHVQSESGQDYGALCGGGHYNNLMKQFGGPDMAGVGFAIGVERIVALMEEMDLFPDLDEGIDIYVMPVGEEMIDDAFMVATWLRLNGFKTETALTPLKLGSMFKKAAKRNAKYAVIIGQDEYERGVCQLKDLSKAEQKEVSLDDLVDEIDALFEESVGEESEREGEEKC